MVGVFSFGLGSFVQALYASGNLRGIFLPDAGKCAKVSPRWRSNFNQ
jgi:hypothetical protein